MPYSWSTLADVQRSKVLLSGARVYLHLPLYPLSRPGQSLDELTGTVCISVAYQSRLSACETRFLLGMVRRLKGWNCLCMEKLDISTGLRMQVRTTIAARIQITGHMTPSHGPFTWPRDKTWKHAMHSLQPHSTGWAILGKRLFIRQREGWRW